ncbi:MAG: hypothetical protein LKH74_05815 [Levilactobacillus sp.]|jgi:hypothetical protein|uniref:hypothetical protein n=1 Tax=Levilactobacillus sp. TaxID=2767919 RepID=UPI00258D55FF|nr:hypothetical protein [Levilactobacillus sp.]MCI1553426.1 hypothetical protein [Levilactobacillus sp.]MCI1597815.1 hypothetical protein [Levilactobacillus sp.]MCI1605577.1 hypothetical protein [Levilactobacillus sp.]
MKLKKILRQLGLLLAFVGLGVGVGVTTGYAAQPGTSLIGAQGSYEQTPNFIDDDSKGFRASYPTLDSVTADGVVNGRITSATKHIYVSFSGNATIKTDYYSDSQFTKFYADVTTYDGSTVTTLNTGSPKMWSLSSGNTVAQAPSSYITIPVDFTNLGISPSLPIYIGFDYGAKSDLFNINIMDYYKSITLTANNNNTSALAGVTINKGNDIPSSSTMVEGTGDAGLTAMLTGGNIKAGDYKTTVQSDGTYKFDLGSTTLKSLGDPSTIKVTEYNQFGDSKSATANVVDTVPLDISPPSTNLTISPDDWADHIAGKSSADIAAWLADQANLHVTKQGYTTPLTQVGDGLAFSTADDLTTLTAGGTQTVNLNAADSNGDKSTTPAAISVTRGLGELQFGDLSELIFGAGATLAVPAQSTLFAPGTYHVNISDSRATGSPWYLSATASTMTDSSGHTLSGDVVYEDGSGNMTKLDAGNAVPVASGTRSGESTDAAKDWTQNGKAYTSNVPAGIYLDAKPNIYTGSTANAYAGTLTWYLNDAPGTSN